MGLFDLFKKKNEPIAFQDNALEAILKKACIHPEYRPDLYKMLLSENIVIIGKTDDVKESAHTLEKDAKMSISQWTDGRIPFFTSTDRIFDKGVIKEQVSFIKMSGRDFFTTVRGASLILNPYSDYGKEFYPEEVISIVDGTALDPYRNIEVKKDTPVQIGQPAKYPTEIVDALKDVFSKNTNVNAAYLGWIYVPDSGEPAHYIFGIDADGDIDEINKLAGFTAKQFLKEEEFVDFIKIEHTDIVDSNAGGLSAYFVKQTEPFYKNND